MVWDLGTYEPQDGISPAEQLARGKIDIVLQGEKLRGGFTLIETGERLVHASKNERWLLIKQRDKYADSSWNIESPRFDRSVLTGRTPTEIETGRPRNRTRLERARV